MNEVDAPCLSNEAQHVLNWASVLHHKTFLRYRDELSQLEAEVKELAEKRGMYMLLSEQREGEVKSLRAELDAAQKEHADLLEQVQQKVDRVDQLQAEMDEVKVMAEEWKVKMDRLASEKETAQEQRASTEAQLRSMKEKAETRSQKIEDLQSHLGSAVAARDTLDKELEAAKLAVEITKADAEEMVAQYKADAEAAQERLKDIVKYVRWQSRREVLEEVHARGFYLSAEIVNFKRLEFEA
uniref:ATP synthase subunit b-like n=1 Tax=Nicotiana tabacum TaxID=4097 RepID=A0A1S3YC61_TOBAC|nr:PREDICTED: ATP synthase subunit b-like [Nicotiana tabacum]